MVHLGRAGESARHHEAVGRVVEGRPARSAQPSLGAVRAAPALYHVSATALRAVGRFPSAPGVVGPHRPEHASQFIIDMSTPSCGNFHGQRMWIRPDGNANQWFSQPRPIKLYAVGLRYVLVCQVFNAWIGVGDYVAKPKGTFTRLLSFYRKKE